MKMVLFAEYCSKLVVFSYWMALHIGELNVSPSPCLAKHDAEVVIVNPMVIKGCWGLLFGGTKNLERDPSLHKVWDLGECTRPRFISRGSRIKVVRYSNIHCRCELGISSCLEQNAKGGIINQPPTAPEAAKCSGHLAWPGG